MVSQYGRTLHTHNPRMHQCTNGTGAICLLHLWRKDQKQERLCCSQSLSFRLLSLSRLFSAEPNQNLNKRRDGSISRFCFLSLTYIIPLDLDYCSVSHCSIIYMFHQVAFATNSSSCRLHDVEHCSLVFFRKLLGEARDRQKAGSIFGKRDDFHS